MEKNKGYDYTVEVTTGVEKYAECVLVLTNYKSSVKETVVGVKTIEGTDLIGVKSLIEIDNLLKSFGTITWKEEITIVTLDSSDLRSRVQHTLDELWDNDKEYYVALDRDGI